MEPNRNINQSRNDGLDRISDFHDLILCKILSFTPTKNAIATSILSKRWKNLDPFWFAPIKLDLDDTSLLQPEMNEFNSSCDRFMDFVDGLLNTTLVGVPCVDTIILNCIKSYGDVKIISWVVAALRLKVRDLELRVQLDDLRSLFHLLNCCETLVRLVFLEKRKPWKLFVLYIPDNFRLPNLKGLTLCNVRFDDATRVGSINELIAGCPELEDLCISDCDFENFKFLCIDSQQLKKLTLEDFWANSPGLLQINAPNLEMLIYKNCVASKYCIHNKFKSLNMACIQVSSRQRELRDDNCVVELVTACSNTARLYLATRSVVALQRSNEQLPTFQNLNSLTLGFVWKYEGWSMLARLLLLAPNLEKLTFEEGFSNREGGYAGFESFLPNPPLCLELRLREVVFKVFEEEEDELKLVEYFLRNGKVVQKLEIHCLPFKEMETSRLLTLPKCSKIDFQPR